MSGNKHTSSKSVVSLFQLRLDLWGLISKKHILLGHGMFLHIFTSHMIMFTSNVFGGIESLGGH